MKTNNCAQGFSIIQLLAFLVLGMMLLGVIFLLPNTIEPVTPINLSETQQQPQMAAPPDSPWSDAQLAKQRRQAQETLSQILDIQQKLENKKVARWAAQSFQQAMQTAAQGDEHYRQRAFDSAQHSYRQSLRQFENLIDQVDAVYQDKITLASGAINNQQPQAAIDNYQLAVALKPASIDAQQGLARAKVQQQVIDLIAKGQHQLKNTQLIGARDTFTAALVLDPQSQPAKAQLATAQQAIVDDNFATAMSQGYRAISSKQYSQAITAFKQAVKIKPANQNAAQSLVQANNKQTQTSIADHLAQAKANENQELWQQAHDDYTKAQQLDSSLLTAKIGVIKTSARAQLDSQLQSAITQPQRMSNAAVLRQNRLLHQDGLKIKHRGPRLQGQLSQLKQLLVQMTQPVAVQLKSDNHTQVTLYKVAKLGHFSVKKMTLKPGKYTLVGTRAGYRDVRREFTLSSGDAIDTIVVQCDEKISNG